MAAVSGFPVFDGHNDTLLDLFRPDRGGGRSFFERSEQGHIDLPRAREGGFGGGFFAVFVPPPPSQPRPNLSDPGALRELPPPVDMEYAQLTTLAMTGLLFRLERESAGQMKVVRTTGELEECLANGTLATILHFEGAEAIDPGLDALELFYNAGLRSIGPVWSRANAFATGVPFRFPSSPDIGPGLTEAGKNLVRACNRLGIMLDLSHLNEAGFWDIAKLSDAPLVATHSNVHALTPTPRNLTDKQLDAVRDTGGLVGLNFGVSFLREDGKRDPNTDLSELVRHADYIVNRIGIDHLALGSDFDGTTISSTLRDVGDLQLVIDAFRKHGYDDASIVKLAHGNWINVLERTWGA